jgi:ADP-ribosylglycohydrolase
MIGAVLGDIIGSSYEFRNRIKTEDFELFPKKAKFTDDTVLTIATADALLHDKPGDKAYYEWGNKYPDAGYGGMFSSWLNSSITDLKPYGSYGNGSAMRVSPIGWYCNNLLDTINYSIVSAVYTHNHEEGILGAKIVAGSIFLARKYKNKDIVKQFINSESNYNISQTVKKIRPTYGFDATCQGSIPEAIICFLESKSYEDAVRKAVSLGGDSDTQACIAGSIAEAFYGIPEWLKNKINDYLPGEMIDIILKFQDKYMS